MSAYKFPGISLMRATQNPDLSLTPTTHGIRIINRGVVLGSDTVPNLGAFVTFNGDQTGGDADPFYCSLTMRSPASGNLNVQLNSGATGLSAAQNAASSFYLFDGSNVQNFGVDQSGNVLFRSSLYFSPRNLQLTDPNTGAWIGPMSPASLAPQSLVIKDNGAISAGDGSVSPPAFGAVINWQGFASFRGIAVGPSSPGKTVIDANGRLTAFGGAVITTPAGGYFIVQNPSGGTLFAVDSLGNASATGNITASGFQTAGQTGQSAIFLLLGTDGHTYYQCTFTNGILTAV
jgi:hypothetical protein